MKSVTQEVFADPIVQLAALCPLCALAALSPAAALAALSPALRIFNPAINPPAALLAFSLMRPSIREQVGARVGTRVAQVRQKVHARLGVG